MTQTRKPRVRALLPRPAADAPATESPVPAATADVEAPRTRMVKGRFRMPKADYALIAVLKSRAASSGVRPRKSDLLRAGLHALMESGRLELRRALERLDPPPRTRRRRQSPG